MRYGQRSIHGLASPTGGLVSSPLNWGLRQEGTASGAGRNFSGERDGARQDWRSRRLRARKRGGQARELRVFSPPIVGACAGRSGGARGARRNAAFGG